MIIGLTTSALRSSHPPVSVTVVDTFRVPLLTGRRKGRSRVEHARVLRVARWARRRERRMGIPAGTRIRTSYFPRMYIDEIAGMPEVV